MWLLFRYLRVLLGEGIGRVRSVQIVLIDEIRDAGHEVLQHLYQGTEYQGKATIPWERVPGVREADRHFQVQLSQALFLKDCLKRIRGIYQKQ